jgi:hypothetical protein
VQRHRGGLGVQEARVQTAQAARHFFTLGLPPAVRQGRRSHLLVYGIDILAGGAGTDRGQDADLLTFPIGIEQLNWADEPAGPAA